MDALTYGKIVWPNGFPWNDAQNHPYDEMDCWGRWVSRAQWEQHKTERDAYFSEISDEEIDRHNAEVYLSFERDMICRQRGPGFVYVRGQAGGPYKIGASKNRQTRRPRKPDADHVVAEVATSEMGLVVSALDDRFEAKKVVGTWLYALDADDIAYVASLADVL